MKTKKPKAKAGKSRGNSRAERNIRWIETHCRVPDGKDVGKPIKLREWQKADLRRIYDNPHGTRMAIISYAKKNAKTTKAAMLVLLHLVGPEARPNTQLPSTAQSQEQAAVLFELAAKMVRMHPDLDAEVTIRDHRKQLFCPALGTLYRALSADASTAHGQSPAFAVHDELGQVRGPRSELFNAIENAMGAHEEPLSIVISTQAPNDADLLSILIDDALEGHDPRTVVSLYTADMEIDPFSEEAIRQANPAFGDFLNPQEILKQAADAKRMPAQEPLYRNYTLNQRVEMTSPFVAKAVWDGNGGEPVFGDEWYGGLDLSETSDLTSLELISFNGTWGVESTFWLPEDGLAERSRKDRVPYDTWRDQGFLEVTPGRSIEYEYVAKHLARLFEQRNIRKIAFDRYNMRHLRPWLVKAGLSESFIDDRFVEFGQGYYSMSPALRNFESLLLNERLRHGGHPILTMCAANAVVKTDEAGSRKLDKKRSRGRIDGMVALAMACEVANANASTSQGVMNEDWLKFWSRQPDSKGNRYLVVYAPHEKKKHPETVMWLIELREDRNYYALEMVRKDLNPVDRTDLMLDLHRKFKPIRVGYEKRGLASDIRHIEDLQSRENYRFRIDELAVPLSESERVMRLVPLFEAGRVVLPQGHALVSVFREEEFVPYPLGFHADMLEGLSMILDMRTAFPSGESLSLDDVIAEGHI
jgi:phage terminase large subunit-like protein